MLQNLSQSRDEGRGADGSRNSLKGLDAVNPTEYNRTALVTSETVDRWLRDYAAKGSPKYTRAYITRMTPKQFVDLTTSVYETEGTGKNRTQRIVIVYRFVGYIELPETALCKSDNYKADTRQGVAVEYIPKPA